MRRASFPIFFVALFTYLIPIEDYFLWKEVKTNEVFFCLDGKDRFWRQDYSGVFGRFGNNAMSLFHANFFAKKQNLRLAILTKSVEIDFLKNSFDNLDNVVWGFSKSDINCAVKTTWMDVFFKKDEIREKELNSFSISPLKLHYRIQAESEMKRIQPSFSIHGRSYEGNCFFSTQHEHTPVKCNFTHNLCKDYRYNTVTQLFNLSGRPVLFSDGQSLYNDITYYKPGGYIDKNSFLTQLWMMVLSKHHVGELGSSLDYLVWLWKRQFMYNTTMYPKQCYPLK